MIDITTKLNSGYYECLIFIEVYTFYFTPMIIG